MSHLSGEQQDAVDAIVYGRTDVAVLAAAGSGKTRVVCAAADAALQARTVRRDELLLLSFSRAAADAMNDRLASDGIPAKARTYHGLALHLMKWYTLDRCVDADAATRKGVPSAASIWSKAAAGLQGRRGVVLDFFSGAEVPSDETDVVVVAARLRLLGSVCTSHGMRLDSPEGQAWAEAKMTGLGAVFMDVAKQKRVAAAWGFDDLLIDFYEELCAGRLKLVLPKLVIVDEGQDNSEIQLHIAEKLSEKGRMVLVGDPRQCIYEWRGAYPKFFLDFCKSAQVAELTTNFRSTSEIVEVGNRLARGQPWNPGSDARPATLGGGVLVLSAGSDAELAVSLAADVSSMLASRTRTLGEEDKEIAILGRTWRSLWPVVQALNSIGVEVACKETRDSAFRRYLRPPAGVDWQTHLDSLEDSLTDPDAQGLIDFARQFTCWEVCMSELGRLEGTSASRVTVSTVHATKGAEYERVDRKSVV